MTLLGASFKETEFNYEFDDEELLPPLTRKQIIVVLML